MIAARGEPVTLRHRPASGGTTDHTATAFLADVDARLVDGETIHRTDRSALVAPASVAPAATPGTHGWFVVEGSKERRVVALRTHKATGGAVAAYELIHRGAP